MQWEPQEKERKKENIWNNNSWEFFQIMSDTKPQIQEAKRTQSRINAKNKQTNKNNTYIIFKIQNER